MQRDGSKELNERRRVVDPSQETGNDISSYAAMKGSAGGARKEGAEGSGHQLDSINTIVLCLSEARALLLQ